jgi:glycosyltransferase involved in cell wall biosynthesis
MNVLMVNRFFWPHLGGVEFHILNLAKALRHLGCDVTVAYRHRGKPDRDEFRGIKLRAVAHEFALPSAVEQEFDIVHAHMTRNTFACSGLIAARARGVATVFTPHCYYPSRSGPVRVAKRLYDATFTRATFAAARAVIHLTPKDEADSVERGLDAIKSTIIPNSISLDELAGVELVDLCTTRGIPRNFILHVGRFEAHKNIDFLVRSHRRFQRDLALVLIGQDDGELARVSALILELGLRKSVFILERAAFHEVCSAYAQARAVVMASSYEGLPTCLLEAMYFGAPIVSTRVGGVPFLVEDGVNGYLYDVGDENNYAKQLGRALSERERTVARARAEVQAHYSWEANAPRVLDVYRQVAMEA